MTTQTQYFNLHTTGIGYLNNIREVTPPKGDAFISCNISALVGDSKNPEYRFFNVNVKGQENLDLVCNCIKSVDEGKKVLISFVIGDLRAETFTHKRDSQYHKKGDTGVMLKGRLIRIKSITIDGKKVWSEQSEPQYQSEQIGDADFENTPPQQERQRPAYRQKQAQQPVQRQYPAGSF